MNNCSFTGRITKDPELTTFESGSKCVRFTLAVDRKYKKDTTDFINFVAWNKLAETIRSYLSKGMLVGITGDLQQRNYEDDNGNKRSIYEVNVNDLSFLEHKKEKKEEAPKPPLVDEEAYIQEENYRDISDEDMLPFDVDGYGG